MAVRYEVRVMQDGKLVTKRRFALRDKALLFAKDKLTGRRSVRILRQNVSTLLTFPNTSWGLKPHDPWTKGPKPISELFVHHSVTKQLPISASVEDEKEQMRLLDSIAHGRGFNGISYCWAIFPSGRCYEGRGWGIVEAGTEGHNTSGDSVVMVGNYSEFKLSALQEKAVRALMNKAQRSGFFVMHGLNVRVHREVSATSCPGSKISAEQIAAIQKSVNSA